MKYYYIKEFIMSFLTQSSSQSFSETILPDSRHSSKLSLKAVSAQRQSINTFSINGVKTMV